MKHLRDYNEGKIEDDCTLMDYVDNCFIEFKLALLNDYKILIYK